MNGFAEPRAQDALAKQPGHRERKGGHADLARGSARSTLLTILGELVWPSGGAARTSSLLYVMTALGVEESAARQAIVRGADAGWIEPHRHGREVSWSVTPHLAEIFREGSERVESLSDPRLDWDGSWLVVFVTVPESLRAARKRLYSGLQWAGLGNPAAGVWITPHVDRRDGVRALVGKLGLAESTLSFVGTSSSVGRSEAELVSDGWDLDSLAADYTEVERRFQDPRPETADETLLTHVQVIDALQRFPFADPQLPEALLPEWIGRRVALRLQTLRSVWLDEVRSRWHEIDAR